MYQLSAEDGAMQNLDETFHKIILFTALGLLTQHNAIAFPASCQYTPRAKKKSIVENEVRNINL